MASESMDKSYKLRFRHLSGDVGPFTFQESGTVLAMKTQIWEDWPTEEPLSSQVRCCYSLRLYGIVVLYARDFGYYSQC